MQAVFTPEKPLVLIGCGHMGHAMAVGWLRAGLSPDSFFVVDPHAASGAVPNLPDGHFLGAFGDLPKGLSPRAVVLAVKPQIIGDVLPQLGPRVTAETLVISIAAGVTLSQLEKGVGAEAVYVRSMPNTPSAVGAGITGFTAAETIEPTDKQLAMELLEAVGTALWIETEDQMNAVTAVSGSGPAYVFYLVECMAAAGVREGLPEETAMQLARQTIIGAARLMDAEADVGADALRRRVTSPGGTTAAALNVLMHEPGMADLMLRTIEAARKRGEELAG